MELTLDLIHEHKPVSILDIINPAIFGTEIDDPSHTYIKSGICYEYYYAISKILQPKTIFEIGNRYGYSGISLMKGSPTATFKGWDLEAGTWGGALESSGTARRNFEKSGFQVVEWTIIDPLDNIQVFLYHQNSQAAVAENVPISDLIHIDGDHSYQGTYHDLEICKTRCKHLIIDDYSFNTPPDIVGPAVDDFIKNNEDIIEQVLHIPTFRKMVYIKFKNR